MIVKLILSILKGIYNLLKSVFHFAKLNPKIVIGLILALFVIVLVFRNRSLKRQRTDLLKQIEVFKIEKIQLQHDTAFYRANLIKISFLVDSTEFIEVQQNPNLVQELPTIQSIKTKKR